MAVDFTAFAGLVAFTAAVLLAALAATVREVALAPSGDFTADAGFLLFAETAGVFAGFFIAFVIESTAN
ncbi:hypothetical protein PQR62_19275 [Herbaspirillum lusitanum]|uniref:Uncharacterized protein n=1 Tax=Herbaspirillum lusitanum TaxID=213312 RepID=A0ABW9AC00_9BURK